MAVATWEEVAGITCAYCNLNPATHFWGDNPICCQCHDPGGGLVSPAEAQIAHDEVLLRQQREAGQYGDH